ncbi:MAG TPA: helix-turn-helix domain-containing protein, partial [Trichococcus sp.]|nr:helix-turn-helix domain-containing protein [Trichococcus sp.]
MIHKTYKFRIYPNQEQQILIGKTIGCSRFVFNRFLSEWNKTYVETGAGLNYCACSAKLTLLKKEEGTLWLKEVDSTALQSSLRNLSDSYDRFFKK